MIFIERPDFVLLSFFLGCFAFLVGLRSFASKRGIVRRIGELSLIGAFSDLKMDRPWLKITLYALSVTSLVFAASGPHVAAHNLLKKNAVDVVAVMDVSKSMSAKDFGLQTRLEKAKEILGDLISQLNNNRIGIVTYAGTTMAQAPLTRDYGALRFIVDEWVQINSVRMAGSDLVKGINTGIDMLKDSGKGRLLILFTDGGGALDGLSGTLDTMAHENVKFIIIGLGSKNGYRFEDQPFAAHFQGPQRYVLSVLEEERLKDIAVDGGGKYINGNHDGLNLADEIVKQAVLEEQLLEGKISVYYIPLIVSIVMFALALFL